VLPSSSEIEFSAPIRLFRSSITQPTDTPVYASTGASRRPPQDSGPRWIRSLLSCRTLSFPTTCRFIPAHFRYRRISFTTPASLSFRVGDDPPRSGSQGRVYGRTGQVGLPCLGRPGDRGPLRRSEESPDTVGQDAGEIPDGESRWKVAQKGDRRPKRLARLRPVRVKGWGKSPPASW